MAKVLRQLHGEGYALPFREGGVEFWCPDGVRPGSGQESLAWFAARLEEAGGRYVGGVARFPSGHEFPVRAKGDRVLVGKWEVDLADLKERPLRECLRAVR